MLQITLTPPAKLMYLSSSPSLYLFRHFLASGPMKILGCRTFDLGRIFPASTKGRDETIQDLLSLLKHSCW